MLTTDKETTLDAWRAFVDPDKLSGFMESRGLGSGDIENVTRLGGGTQNILLKFNHNDRTYVLRRPPAHLREHSNETMRREMRMLEALSTTSVPHPKLLLDCPDESILGVAFYLMEPIDGFAPICSASTILSGHPNCRRTPINGLPALHRDSPDIRRRMGLNLIEGITALADVDYRAVGLEGFGNPDNYLSRQVSRWKSQLESYHNLSGWPGPAKIPGVERVAHWLDKHQPSGFDPGIIHGDYHCGNVMFSQTGPELAAIVDWELTTIGDPLVDLGWLLATWPENGEAPIKALELYPFEGYPSSQDLIEHYRGRTNRNMDYINWDSVLACYKLGIILEGTHARACAGKAPKEYGDMLHTSTINLFERALKWIN